MSKIISLTTRQNVYFHVGSEVGGNIWDYPGVVTKIDPVLGDPSLGVRSSYVVTMDNGEHLDIEDAAIIRYAPQEKQE